MPAKRVLVGILGAIDLASAFVFLMLVFGMVPPVAFLIFCGVLLFLKSLFLLGGDVLSFIDLLSALFLFLSIFLTLPIILLWIPAFFLLAKGVVSFF